MTEPITEGITSEGLILKNYDTLLNELQSGMNGIYATDGDEINFDSETPDGQFTNIITQIGEDLRELATEVYNSFDPDNCSGSVQDTRYALNYITRNSGTYTIQNIDVTVNQTVTLQGLDSNYNETDATAYTISDNAGNLWYLIDTTTLQPGTVSLPFRSKNLGLVQPVIGTITTQVTTVLGVTSVINSVAPTTLGAEQETDTQFRVRRNRSTERKGQNNIDAMLSQLLDLEGVSDATTWVNPETETDSTGTPAGYVWVIVEGGANSDIADVIYTNSCGHGMRGSIEVDVPASSGQIFNVKFDRPTPVPLYIKFDFYVLVEDKTLNTSGITSDMAAGLTYILNENAETSKPTCAARDAIEQNGGNGYPLNLQISTDGSTWVDFIACPSLASKFVVDSSRITVNITGQGQ